MKLYVFKLKFIDISIYVLHKIYLYTGCPSIVVYLNVSQEELNIEF